VGGLSTNANYNFTVTATNEYGTSPSVTPIVNDGNIDTCTNGPNCDLGPISATYPSYGNVAPTNLGDCTFAAAANWEQIVLGASPDQTQIGIEFIQAGGSPTKGLAQTSLWKYWENSGIAGVYLTKFTLYFHDQIDVKNGVLDFGAMIVELQFQNGWGFGNYIMTSSSTHDVVIDGFTPEGPLVVTWGGTLQMTWQQWNTEVIGMWGVTT
jgi:hypothetical protein